MVKLKMDMDTITTEQFIALVQSHPILYGLSARGYHVKTRKNNVWTTIATEFNITGNVFRLVDLNKEDFLFQFLAEEVEY